MMPRAGDTRRTILSPMSRRGQAAVHRHGPVRPRRGGAEGHLALEACRRASRRMSVSARGRANPRLNRSGSLPSQLRLATSRRDPSVPCRVDASVTIIIPVYRDSDALARTLAATDWSGAEVIVVATRRGSSARAAARRAPGRRLGRGAARTCAADECRRRGRARRVAAVSARGHAAAGAAGATAIDAGRSRRGDRRRAASASRSIRASSFARIIELGVRAARRAVRAAVRRPGACSSGGRASRRLGGFADLPIMEDVDLVRRMRRDGALFRSPLPAVTSARRWERDGWIAARAGISLLISLYFCGVPPARLVRLDRRAGCAIRNRPRQRMSL